MKKTLFFAAAAIAMLASCSQNDLEAPVVAQAQQGDAIEFGTYTGQSAQTRTIASGTAGAITTDELLQGKGFGVFAYYTGANTYNQKNGAYNAAGKIAPNFMWNQRVTYTTSWGYTPVKYWPNDVQNGAVDDQDNHASNNQATGDGTNGGNLTFFAYAPYVASNNAASGTISSTPDEGITGFSTNTTTGDPTITYVVPASGSDIVDLLWGTRGTTSTNVNGAGNAGVTTTATSYVAAPVENRSTWMEDIAYNYTMNADLTKQKTDGVVDFAFKHALAKFGGFQGLKIITDVNNGTAVSGGNLDNNKDRVTVKSINIVARAKNTANTKYYATQAGTFNLATGKWTITGTEQVSAPTGTSFSIPVAMMNTAIAEPASVTTWDNVSGITGVPSSGAVNVYANLAAETQPVVFIPGTKPELTVTVDYVVRTNDTNLSVGYSEVEQVITKKITFANAVELNKYYTLIIHLGLEDINFTASVGDWVNSGASETDVYLPINVAPVTP